MKKKYRIKKLSISISDLSQGKSEAFLAVLHDYKDAKVMGDDLPELFKGISATIKYFEDKKASSRPRRHHLKTVKV